MRARRHAQSLEGRTGNGLQAGGHGYSSKGQRIIGKDGREN
jgi:hypothetical protein